MIRLTVLGGAAACPNPSQGCAGYLIETEKTALLIDCGPGILPELQRVRALDTLDALVISHLHADHTLDLIPLRYGLKYMPGLSRRRLALWLPPGGSQFLNGLARALAATDEEPAGFFDEVFALHEFNPATTLDCGDVHLTFFPTQHWIPCWAMRVTEGEHHLGYSADTGPIASLADFFTGVELFICEGTLLEQPAGTPPEFHGHLTARQAGALARAAGATHLILSHYWANLGRDRLAREAAEAFGKPVVLAYPGLQVTLAP